MPDLTGNRIFLREYTSSDLDMVHQWMSDSEVMRFLSWGPTKTRDETFIQLADFMRHRAEYREGGIRFDKWVNRLVYAILDSEWKFGKS